MVSAKPFALASLGDAWQNILEAAQGNGSKPRFLESSQSLHVTDATPSAFSPSVEAASSQPAPDLPSFHMRARRSVVTQQAAAHAQHILCQQEAHHSPVFAFLNRHVLPVLTHVAIAQHQAMVHLTDRLRGIRLRNLLRGHRNDHSADGRNRSTFPRTSRHSQRLLDTALNLERALDPVAAAEAFHAAIQADDRHPEWVTLAAKQWSDASYLDGTNPATAAEYNKRAVALASQAVELAPTAAHGYMARCVSRGRLALLCDNRTKVQLAKDACDDAAQALALEPHNDFAHHLMGRWHYEMAGLNALARTLVRFLYGTALMCGSYESAAHHFARASDIAPSMLIHRAELGRSYHKLGKHQEAISELNSALRCEVVDINAHLTKLEVEKLLKLMEKDHKAAPFWIPTGG